MTPHHHKLLFVSYIPTEDKQLPRTKYAIDFLYKHDIPCMFFDNGHDTWIDVLHNSVQPPPYIPQYRNFVKDTREYILAGHRKHDYMERAIQENPDVTHFVWIDVDLFYDAFHSNNTHVAEYLKWMKQSISQWSPRFLAFPGCWSKESVKSLVSLSDTACWRFIGGVFMGDRDSLHHWLQSYKTFMTKLICEERVLTWHFNVWAWMEQTSVFGDLTWYHANHDDSMLYVPPDLYSPQVPALSTRALNPHLIKLNGFYATSTSYILYDNQPWANTRYVNYHILPNGRYTFSNCVWMRRNYIYNINVLSKLSEEGVPISSRVVSEDVLDTQKADYGVSDGLEDLRLFVGKNDEVKYIATTSRYSHSGRLRIIVGEYDLCNAKILSGEVIEPPTDTWCEKNWIPIRGNMEELYLYRWWPTLQYGVIHENALGSKRLQICREYPMHNPIFRNVRGSSVFSQDGDFLLGVVHFSMEGFPRHYYHMLVRLCATSFRLCEYTTPFRFGGTHGIEFCIGMSMDNPDTKEMYKFWVSFYDRDPTLIEIAKSAFIWLK
jgi:hypothetical protein